MKYKIVSGTGLAIAAIALAMNGASVTRLLQSGECRMSWDQCLQG
jgi:hypothetical protein